MHSELSFEWDEQKNKDNIHRHGVSFEEAKSVFYDENAMEFFDPDHSESEDRFIMLGMSEHPRVLVVCHCFRQKDKIRIISSRKADEEEEKDYWRTAR